MGAGNGLKRVPSGAVLVLKPDGQEAFVLRGGFLFVGQAPPGVGPAPAQEVDPLGIGKKRLQPVANLCAVAFLALCLGILAVDGFRHVADEGGKNARAFDRFGIAAFVQLGQQGAAVAGALDGPFGVAKGR